MEADTWNNRLKNASETIASQIPEVGFLIEALIKLFWPTDKIDIWNLIKDQVQKLVDTSVLKKELEERQEELHGIQQSLKMYVDDKNKEKGSIMSSILVLTNELFYKLTESSNAHHLIPLTCAAAHLHLGLLLERMTHGKDIYDEDNTSTWTRELHYQHSLYKTFFINVYPKWKEWRSSFITAGWGTFEVPMVIPPFFTWTAYGDACDSLTGEKIHYEDSMDRDKTNYKIIMQAIQLRMRRQVEADMISQVMSTSFTINAYLPGQATASPDVDPAIETFVLGPYSVATLGHDNKAGSYLCATDIADAEGKITNITVREWNSIDMIQFTYTNHKGNAAGDPKGGTLHTITPKAGAHFTGLKMMFFNGIMCSVEVCMSDKTTSGVLGNRSNWPGWQTDGVVDSSYEMTGAKFESGSGPSNTSGVGVIELVFRHSSKLIN